MDQNLYVRRHTIQKNTWYKLNLTLEKGTSYKKGLVKLFVGAVKSQVQIFPSILLPNIIFATKVDKVDSVDDLDKLDDFTIYFRNKEEVLFQIYSINLKIKNSKLDTTTDVEAKKAINLWKLRKYYDLEFINYYIENLFKDFNPTFVDRFNSEYKLFKYNSILDAFIMKLKVEPDKGTSVKKSDKLNVLYITSSSIQYENTGYTQRTQALLNAVNKKEQEYTIYALTRYGYPFEKSDMNPASKLPDSSVDRVSYIRMGSKEDNVNTCNILDYLKKYITEGVKIAQQYDAKIVHGVTNYWNGLVAYYIARYLKIKSVYEVRDFWEDSCYLQKPEIFESDGLKLKSTMETFVMQKVNKVVTVNNDLREQIIGRGVQADKVTVIPDGVNMTLMAVNNDPNEYVVGYVGRLKEEYVELLMEATQKLDCKLILIGDEEANDSIKKKVLKGKNVQIVVCATGDELINQVKNFNVCVFPGDQLSDTDYYSLYRLVWNSIPVVVLEKLKSNELEGVFYFDGTIDNLVSQIQDIKASPDKRRDLMNKGKEWINKYKSWDYIGNKLVDVYNECIL